jgi:2,3-bisphosphoglycerate-independent phosphoglycerate mutase
LKAPHEIYSQLKQTNDSKLVLLVADGLGGLPLENGGPTELEAARTPNLDALVSSNTCGAALLVAPGVTPGSGPGHLALFGFDPLEFNIGRGVLEALGVDLELCAGDVAIRGNFCTVDTAGRVTDRRAGRISSAIGAQLVELLKSIRLESVEMVLRPVEGYRFVIRLRGEGLDGNVSDTDPGLTGLPPRVPEAISSKAARTAQLVSSFVEQARMILSGQEHGNMVLLRGIASPPTMPTLAELYGLRSAAIAVYPMYRGLARLVGMEILQCGPSLSDQIVTLRANWSKYDFFFIHFKHTDSRGEDGDFAAKVRLIEELDTSIPGILALRPDVLVVTGDHSTPAKLRSHSWHPVPLVLAANTCLPDQVATFGERACHSGGLGQFEAKYLLGLMLAHAGRLAKFGA